jgi:FlgD Ig-like domain
LRRILFAALLAGLLPALASEREQRFAFALPEAEGRISLGVFDSTGKLRRTLYVSAAEGDFKIGLNGLIASWDGRDDSGKPLPAGQYRVRGYLVTDDLKAEGIAYHFNDWVDDEKAPRITRIDDFRKQPGGVVVLAQALNDTHPLVFRFDQLRGFLWATSLGGAVAPGTIVEAAGPTDEPRYHLAQIPQVNDSSSSKNNRLLATTEDYAAVLVGDTLHLLDMSAGTVISTQANKFPQVECFAASHDALLLGSQAALTKVALPNLEMSGEIDTPIPFDSLAVHGEQMLAASASYWQVWGATDGKWEQLPLTIAASSLSFGFGETFWVTAIDEKDGKPFTGQFNRQGEFLRSYRDEFSPVRVCASTAIEEIAVLEKSGTTQRLRVLSLGTKSMNSPGEWIVDFEKVIQSCEKFGIVKGKLMADAGTVPQIDDVEVSLSGGGLSASAEKLAVRVTSDHAGLWLTTKSGLRLAFLASQPNVRRVVIEFRPEKKMLLVYAGDGAVVAEYAVKGLANIVEIDAGDVELP